MHGTTGPSSKPDTLHTPPVTTASYYWYTQEVLKNWFLLNPFPRNSHPHRAWECIHCGSCPEGTHEVAIWPSLSVAFAKVNPGDMCPVVHNTSTSIVVARNFYQVCSYLLVLGAHSPCSIPMATRLLWPKAPKNNRSHPINTSKERSAAPHVPSAISPIAGVAIPTAVRTCLKHDGPHPHAALGDKLSNHTVAYPRIKAIDCSWRSYRQNTLWYTNEIKG